MANYTLNSTLVQPSANAKGYDCTGGATIGAGQPCYLDATALDSKSAPKAKLADANDTAATALVKGIAANSCSDGQPLRLITEDDDFTHGLSTVAVGDLVVLSATAGALCPHTDLASGHYPVALMTITSSTKAKIRILAGTAPRP